MLELTQVGSLELTQPAMAALVVLVQLSGVFVGAAVTHTQVWVSTNSISKTDQSMLELTQGRAGARGASVMLLL
jgi:hypothetical protein